MKQNAELDGYVKVDEIVIDTPYEYGSHVMVCQNQLIATYRGVEILVVDGPDEFGLRVCGDPQFPVFRCDRNIFRFWHSPVAVTGFTHDSLKEAIKKSALYIDSCLDAHK